MKLKKQKIYLYTSDYERFSDWFFDKKNCTIKETGSSMQYITDDLNLVLSKTDFMFCKYHFSIIRKIKKDIERMYNLKHEQYANMYGGGMRTFDFNYTGLNEEYAGYEIDLSACYANTAYNIGLIGTDTYRLIMGLPKAPRLRILGAIAANKIVEIYENGTLVNITNEKNEFFIMAWKAIVNYSYYKMLQISKKLESYLLFWVDAFFLRGDSELQKVQELIKQNGYTSKVKKIETMYYSESVPENTDLRIFNFTVKKENEPITYICLPDIRLYY